MTRSQEPEKRLSERNIALSPGSCTAKRLPVKLVNAEYLDMVVDVIAAEREIKGWSRAKKVALIAGNWDEVVRLSKRTGRESSVTRLTLRGLLRSRLRVRNFLMPRSPTPLTLRCPAQPGLEGSVA